MIRRVVVSADVFETAHEQFGESRPPQGDGSEYDFVGGPLAAAVFAFREFDTLSYDVVSAVRSYTVVDPVFGPVTFTATLRIDGPVEIVGFSHDPDYWTALDADPERVPPYRGLVPFDQADTPPLGPSPRTTPPRRVGARVTLEP